MSEPRDRARSEPDRRGEAPSAELRARVFEAVGRVPAPTRAEQRTRTLLVAAGAVLAMTLLFFAMGGVRPGTRPAELIGFTSGLGLVVAIVVSQTALARGHSMLGRPRHELIILCLALAPALAIVPLIAAALWPLDTADQVPPPTHLVCGLLTVLHGLLPLGALLLLRSGTDPVHPALTGAVLGTTAGAWTAMIAYLRCPHAEPFHCIVAHVVPTVLFALAGIFLGGVVLRMRSQNP